MVDPQRAPVIKKMFEKVAYEKWSGRKVYHWLRFDMNFRAAASNKPLTLSNVHKLLQTPFFYGSFEYPVKSGKWYVGKHEPIITKELFEKVQQQMKRDCIVRGETKEFAFTKLLRCGLCGSGVSAEEKFKKLKKSGLTARYVYYGCNRSKDRTCNGGYIREENLISQIINLIDVIDFNEPSIQQKFNEECQRAERFRRQFLGMNDDKNLENKFLPKLYIKHILRHGQLGEKRELFGLLKEKLILKNKKIFQE
jgi:hypothetical protein